MSTDIAVPATNSVAEIDKLYAWVNVAQATHQAAIGLSKTSFVPASMRGKPEEITACIMAGRELGFEPMASLRAIDIIDGNPTLRALAMRAIAQTHGNEVWLEESTMSVAVVCGIRKGSDHVQRSVWTIERAEQAGLTKKRNWLTNPTAMLVARATSEVCRLVAADALMAMPYSSEEMRDERPDEPAPTPEPTEPTEPEPTVTFRRDPKAMPPAGPVDDLADTVSSEEFPEAAAEEDR